MAVVATLDMFKGVLTGGLATGGFLAGAKLGLFTNNPTLGPNTVLGDLTEPVYTGYARHTITWTAPLIPPEGSWAVEGDLALFQMTDALAPTTVSGFFVITAGGTPLLLWAEYLANPIFLTSPDQAVQISPELLVIGTEWGEGTVVV